MRDFRSSRYLIASASIPLCQLVDQQQVFLRSGRPARQFRLPDNVGSQDLAAVGTCQRFGQCQWHFRSLGTIQRKEDLAVVQACQICGHGLIGADDHQGTVGAQDDLLYNAADIPGTYIRSARGCSSRSGLHPRSEQSQ